GHHSASSALRKEFAEMKENGEDVEFILEDPLKRPGDELYPWSRRFYLLMIRKIPWLWGMMFVVIDQPWHTRLSLWLMRGLKNRLRDILAEHQPDVVVSTYPIFPHFLEYYELLDAHPNCANVIIVTDSITVNTVWTTAKCDAFVVPNELTADVLRKRGIPEEKIRPLGFPVNPDIVDAARASSRQIPPREGEQVRVLYMINSGRMDSKRIAIRLAKIPDIKLTITVAFDDRLLAGLRKALSGYGDRVEVLNWTNRLPELFSESHLLVAKAGGATTQEALAAGLPMVVTKAVPGQEPGNAQLLEKLGAGIFVGDRNRVTPTVKKLLEDNCKGLGELVVAGGGSPDGAAKIARLLMEIEPSR
ncbi:MAG: glycosyltransferase, partial [Chthoniobacterales bacterium]